MENKVTMQTEQIIRELPTGLIKWYEFQKGSKVLFITDTVEEFCALPEVLEKRGLEVDVYSLQALEDTIRKGCSKAYDYVILVGILERSRTPVKLLRILRDSMSAKGRLLIGADNRLGIRYFCGDKDVFTGHVYDGIEGYVKVSPQRREKLKGRAYSKDEIRGMLSEAGYEKYKFYSVMPSIFRPQILISEDYIPNERLDIRIFPQYESPQTVFLEEERLYDGLLKNGMFHSMANGFLIECVVEGELTGVSQITVSGDRGPGEAMMTIIRAGLGVTKKPLYSEGVKKTFELMENTQYLLEHGVPMVEAKLENDCFVMPYVEGEIATEYFRRMLREDKEKFFAELERFKALVEKSSERVPYNEINWQQFEPGWEKRKADDPNIDKWKKLAYGSKEEKKNIGIILKRGYIDLVSLNCFHTDGGFLFFDQEFYIENLPANAILIRTIDFIYRDCSEMELLYEKEKLLKDFSLYEHQDVWRKKGNAFLERLRNEKALLDYHCKTRRDCRTMVSNRLRMDYSQEEYDKLFGNIFKDVGHKKLYLFGSGKYSEKFIEQFSKYYDIAGILDNNQEKWGTRLSGIKISAPDILKEEEAPFKVFICIKFFEEVLKQLKEMGIKDISVYDPRLDYDRPLKNVTLQENTKPKKYHIGYVAGVFDLFHIGHLNMFKRAKEQCDYLIVGVVSDEQVIKNKKTCPYIPFKERFELVQACKYVDEAVRIPADRPTTEDAYRMYHFDVQFSGSDYADDPEWLAKRTFLQQRGSELVFFPYTQSTSSTKLKALIEKKLL